MIIITTYIDAHTGVSVQKEPTKSGPVLPKLYGLRVLWARTSAYPTEVPEFICEVTDEQDISIPGVLGVLTPDEEKLQYAEELLLREQQAFNQKANPIRTKRNELLAESDVYVIVDYPVSEAKRSEWKQYRQTLRDVTLQTTFPESVEWPIQPLKE